MLLLLVFNIFKCLWIGSQTAVHWFALRMVRHMSSVKVESHCELHCVTHCCSVSDCCRDMTRVICQGGEPLRASLRDTLLQCLRQLPWHDTCHLSRWRATTSFTAWHTAAVSQTVAVTWLWNMWWILYGSEQQCHLHYLSVLCSQLVASCVHVCANSLLSCHVLHCEQCSWWFSASLHQSLPLTEVHTVSEY